MLVKDKEPIHKQSAPNFLQVPPVQNGLPHTQSSISLTSNVSLSSFSIPTPGKHPPISKFRLYLPQILAVSVKNVLLLAYGMTLGIATIVIPAVDGNGDNNSNELTLTKSQISWFSSINLICVPLGCIFSGPITQAIGRKRAMQMYTIPIFTSWMLLYFANNVWYLYAGLCCAGLTGGLLEAPVLTYVAEITVPAIRGSLSSTGSFSIIIGVVSQFFLGTFMHWRNVALTSCVLPIIALILLFFVPESPYWLTSKKRYKDAEESLAWLRGWVTVNRIQREYKQIRDRASTITTENPTGYLSRRQRIEQYKSRSFVIPLILVSLAFFIGHFSGMTTLQTYAVQIFHTLKAPIDKYYATLLLGVVEIIGVIVCVSSIHYTGKRPLAIISTIGCGICFLLTATYAHFIHAGNIMSNGSAVNLNQTTVLSTTVPPFVKNDTDLGILEAFSAFTNDYNEEVPDMNDTLYDSFQSNISEIVENLYQNSMSMPQLEESNKYAWIPMTLLLGSALLSHCGIRVLPWILIGEVFPARMRAAGAGISSGLGYVFGFAANKLFLGMLSSMTMPGTFWFYSIISMLGALILYWILPETEGRTLLEIEDHFSGKRSLDTTNVNRTPKKLSTASSVSKKTSRSFQLDVNASNLAFEKNLQAHNYNPKDVLSHAQKKGDIIVSVPSAAAMGVKKSKQTHIKSNKNENAAGETNLAFESEKETTRL